MNEDTQVAENMGAAEQADHTNGHVESRTGLPGQEYDQGRPDGLPEKFWDADNNQVRTDALYKSYRELEHRFGGSGENRVPESHDEYQINIDPDTMASDPEVNSRLHDAGFTQEQAQLVYDLAAEYLGPMAGNLTADVASEMDRRRLAEHFGGEERWREMSAQLRDWGNAKLGDGAFADLAGSYEGVLALHQLMSRDEPELLNAGQAASSPVGEEGLKELMRDPRYWRDHDPVMVNKIKKGFARLYPEPQ